MKKLIITLVCIAISLNISAQKYKPQPWSLSTSLGYIEVVNPYSGSNLWTSVNVGYSVKKWSFGTWVGYNYWIKGKQQDFRVGVSTNYTIKKW